MGQGRPPLLTTWQWLTVVGVLIVSALGSLAWAYTTFQTKDDSEKHDQYLEKRLDAMERHFDERFDDLSDRIEVQTKTRRQRHGRTE